jgi:hypothetical protein
MWIGDFIQNTDVVDMVSRYVSFILRKVGNASRDLEISTALGLSTISKHIILITRCLSSTWQMPTLGSRYYSYGEQRLSTTGETQLIPFFGWRQIVLPQVQVDTGVTWTWLGNDVTWSNLHRQVMHRCGLQVRCKNFPTRLNLPSHADTKWLLSFCYAHYLYVVTSDFV